MWERAAYQPTSFTARALIALAAEAALAVITVIWLHRKPSPPHVIAANRTPAPLLGR